NLQRETIYKQRKQVLDGEDVHDYVAKIVSDHISTLIGGVIGEDAKADEADMIQLRAMLSPVYVPLSFFENSELLGLDEVDLTEAVLDEVMNKYASREAEFSEEIMRELERIVLLRSVDDKWMDHIDAMQELRQGIQLRAYGQNDPVIAYKKEGFEMFESMIESIREETARSIMTVRLRTTEEQRATPGQTFRSHGDSQEYKKKPVVRKSTKIGRNDPCPCGSGKKYKKCCGFSQ
ncbi:MAG: preprotein translocase subunit SecA, partial [Bacteroidales bacterium]|nr:preprotein translocase subunit SecA [Bacteroidales bacterium]